MQAGSESEASSNIYCEVSRGDAVLVSIEGLEKLIIVALAVVGVWYGRLCKPAQDMCAIWLAYIGVDTGRNVLRGSDMQYREV